jgi:xanthine dehydrogenase accessory factor
MLNWVSLLEKFRLKSQPLVLVTVAQTKGSVPREIGAKMIVLSDKSIYGTIGGGHLEELAIQEAIECIQIGATKTVQYPLAAKAGQCCGGSVELLFEVLNNGPRLYIFGAGHVGRALCRTLEGTPFSVYVIDEREDWVMSPKIPDEVIRYHGDWSDFIEKAYWDERHVYVVIMTHRHDLDQVIVEKIISKQAAFIGMIGSESKWQRFMERFRHKGLDEKKFSKVKCPVGVSLGGKAPQEIAISIAAELLRTHHGK